MTKITQLTSHTKTVVHICMYIKWMILNNLISSYHLDHSKKGIDKVKSEQITGRDFLIKWCDKKISKRDFNLEGNRFTRFYYEEIAHKDYTRYTFDLVRVFKDFETMHHVEDNAENYKKLGRIIDARFRLWQRSN